MKKIALTTAFVMLAMAGLAQAQTTTLSLTVGAEASLTVTNGTTILSTTGTNFATPYTGTTSFTYQIRTKTNGAITSKVTADFAGSGGPSVGTPPSAGDELSYSCTVSSPAAACSAQSASTSASTAVASFGAGVSSAKAGNSGSVAWSLTDDPVYATGTYTATVTFQISAT